jgi:hypothetical protein
VAEEPWGIAGSKSARMSGHVRGSILALKNNRPLNEVHAVHAEELESSSYGTR